MKKFAQLAILATALLAKTGDHNIVSAVYAPDLGVVRIFFSDKLKAVPSSAETTVTLKSGAKIDASRLVVHFEGQGTRSVAVHINGAPVQDVVTQIAFSTVHFADDTTGSNVNSAVDNPGDGVIKITKLMQQIANTQSEKSIFASGLATTSSSGTAGAADVNLNSIDLGIPNLKTFLQLKKATAKEGDPKNFEFGLNYMSAIAIQDPAANRTITAILLDFAGKSEGTASKFGVNNIVGDTSVSLQSPVFDLGPRSSAHFRILGGFEGGSNRSKGDAPVDAPGFAPLKNVDWIARSKFGVEGALHVENPMKVLPFELIELRAGGVVRHLYFDELRYDMATDKVDKTTKGAHPWAQVDLKLMLGHTNQGNYGLKLTYQRGSLPPVFATTKAFQFGFVFETGDRTEH